MAFLSDLCRPRPLARPLLYPQTDDPSIDGSATDPSGASPGGSMAALITPGPVGPASASPAPAWSPFFGGPPPAPAPNLENALDALAAMLGIRAAPAASESAGAGDQPLLQFAAARGAAGRNATAVRGEPAERAARRSVRDPGAHERLGSCHRAVPHGPPATRVGSRESLRKGLPDRPGAKRRSNVQLAIWRPADRQAKSLHGLRALSPREQQVRALSNPAEHL